MGQLRYVNQLYGIIMNEDHEYESTSPVIVYRKEKNNESGCKNRSYLSW